MKTENSGSNFPLLKSIHLSQVFTLEQLLSEDLTGTGVTRMVEIGRRALQLQELSQVFEGGAKNHRLVIINLIKIRFYEYL